MMVLDASDVGGPGSVARLVIRDHLLMAIAFSDTTLVLDEHRFRVVLIDGGGRYHETPAIGTLVVELAEYARQLAGVDATARAGEFVFHVGTRDLRVTVRQQKGGCTSLSITAEQAAPLRDDVRAMLECYVDMEREPTISYDGQRLQYGDVEGPTWQQLLRSRVKSLMERR